MLDLKELSPEEVGLEMVITETNSTGEPLLVESLEFKVDQQKGSECTYLLNLHLMDPGAYSYGLRLFPKNENLPHRQDFKLMNWI